MDIIGHDSIRQRFQSLVSQKALPQTSIFYGLNGIGKRLVAMELVLGLFCQEDTQTVDMFAASDEQKMFCGRCQSCQMVQELTHPDLFLIQPTPPKSLANKAGAEAKGVQSNWTIKIEQVQELKTKLIHFPLQADYQVVIIDDADRMTTTTANSLLKILEEPKPNQIFIMITSQLNRVLPTLRSRSSQFYFTPLQKEDVKNIVTEQSDVGSDIDAQNLEFLCRSFHGSPYRVLQALQAGFDVNQLKRLTGAQNDFKKIMQIVDQMLESGLDTKLVLQCIRQYHLENFKTLNGDLDFFDKIDMAEFELSRHIQKDFVLENLFI